MAAQSAGDALVVVGAGVGQHQQEPFFSRCLPHEPSHGAQRQAVPVPSGGHIVHHPVVLLRMVVVPQDTQHRAAADGAEGCHPHGDVAAGQALHDDVCLRRQLLLLLVLGGGAVQQNIHRQLAGVVGLTAGEHPLIVQRRRPPCQRRAQGTGAAQAAVVLLLQQEGVVQLLGQAGDGQPVLGQLRLVIGAVLLPLAAELLRVPRGLRAGRALGRRAVGNVQAAVLVDAGAQGALHVRQLGGRQQRYAEAVLHIAPQDRLRRAPLQKAEQRGLLQSARTACAAAQRPQTVGTHEPHAAGGVPLSPDPCRPLAVGGAAARPAEVGIEDLLRPADELRLRGLQGRGDVRQHRDERLVTGLSQHLLRPRTAQRAVGHALGGRRVSQQHPGVGRPQVGQDRALLRPAEEHRVLQHQEEHVGVQPLLHGAVEVIQKRAEQVEAVVPPGQTQHRVAVQIGIAAAVEHQQLRLGVIGAAAVPDLILCPAGLYVLSVHISRTARPARRPWAGAPTPRPPPAAARRARTPC